MRTYPLAPSAWRTRTQPGAPDSTSSSNDARLRLEGERRRGFRTLPYIGYGDVDKHHATRCKRLPFDPGEAAERIAHLDPGTVGRDDLDREIAAGDVEPYRLDRRRVVHHRCRLGDRAVLGLRRERQGERHRKRGRAHQCAISMRGSAVRAWASTRAAYIASKFTGARWMGGKPARAIRSATVSRA